MRAARVFRRRDDEMGQGSLMRSAATLKAPSHTLIKMTAWRAESEVASHRDGDGCEEAGVAAILGLPARFEADANLMN